MTLRRQYLTKNGCYRTDRTIQVKGVISTGANNPLACRYVPGGKH